MFALVGAHAVSNVGVNSTTPPACDIGAVMQVPGATLNVAAGAPTFVPFNWNCTDPPPPEGALQISSVSHDVPFVFSVILKKWLVQISPNATATEPPHLLTAIAPEALTFSVNAPVFVVVVTTISSSPACGEYNGLVVQDCAVPLPLALQSLGVARE